MATPIDELFERYGATRDRELRNELVERHMGLAAHIARRYSRPGLHDDVRQAAMVGLVKAVERFDAGHGVAFSTFAGSTIEGELKRFLRDHTWVVRVPRSAKELHLVVERAVDELQHRAGRSPSVDELASHLGIDRDDVLRGLTAGAARRVETLDHGPPDATGSGTAATRALGTDDPSFDALVDRHAVEALLDTLPEREQQIVRLRFFEELSQDRIAERMGISQMHVSRLLRRAFDQLRAQALDASEEVDR